MGRRWPTLRDPRLRAALAYALPLAPALYLLWRERDNRFVRLHAAQALTFFTLVAVAQVVLFALVVMVGNLLPGGWLAAVVGLLFWAAFIALGVGGFTLWLRLLNDCAQGRVRRRRLLTPLAKRIESSTLLFTRSASAAYHAGRNASEDARPDEPERPPSVPTPPRVG